MESVLREVQLAFQYPIFYEEIPLESKLELKEVTGTNHAKGLVSPVSTLTVTLSAQDSTPYLAAESVLSAYIQAAYPGVYRVVQREHRIDILPAQVRTESGSSRTVTPILDTPISIMVGKRSVVDTLDLILEAASKQTGYRIQIVGAPTPHFQNIEFGATGQSLGDVLENLSTALSTTYSFALRYVPGDKTYYFDTTNVIAAPTASGTPWVQTGKRPNPTNGPDNSPFFVKDK